MESFLPTKRKRNSDSSNSVWLPHDVMVKILSLLPARSLHIFRCVCKSWNSTITQDSSFAARHLKNRPGGGILSLSCTRRCWGAAYHSPPFLSCTVADHSDPVKFNLRLQSVPESTSYYSITNSCDGLVGIFGLRSICVANPSIGKLAALPGESLHSGLHKDDRPQAGIGFDASSGKYKVVRLFGQLGQYRAGCEVCTLGRGGWRRVRDAPVQHLYYPTSQQISDTSTPVLVDGSVHWTVLQATERGLRPDVALSFDLRNERFHVVRHPMGWSRPVSSRVIALGGRLCIADTNLSKMQMDIWVRGDRGWAKQYDINLLGMHQCTATLGENAVPVTLRADGIMVLCDGEGRRDYYDPQTGCFLLHEMSDQGVNFEYLVTYTDSLVWPWHSTRD